MNDTIEELADQAGLDPDQVARVLRALRRPPIRMVVAGQDALMRCVPDDAELETKVFRAMVDAALT